MPTLEDDVDLRPRLLRAGALTDQPVVGERQKQQQDDYDDDNHDERDHVRPLSLPVTLEE